MIRGFTALLALCGLAVANPSHALDPARIDTLAETHSFAGVLLASRGDTIIYARAFGSVQPGSPTAHRLDDRWRWASITKQLVATVTMQLVSAGQLELDAPVSRYWTDFPNPRRDSITIRHLLQHRSGLPDPDDTARQPSGLPIFYSEEWGADMSREGYCAGPSRSSPGDRYAYTNCDYIILGALLERVTGGPLEALISGLVPGTIALFPQGGSTVPGYHFGQSEPPVMFAAYGGAGGLNGTIFDLWRFDRALMRGDLLDEESRRAMWTGDPAIGHAALGQWVFPAPLAGCAAPQQLVERTGAIGGVQTRNYILPERDMVVIAFTNRSEQQFAFGSFVEDNRGFAHDLLATVVCGEEQP